MKITNIKQQQKRTDRYAVYVDEKYSFSLSELGLINSGLHVGQELSKDQLSELKKTAQFDKAYDRTLRWVAIRPRSEWEIDDYFRRKATDEEIGKQIKERLREFGYLNDEAFAKAWVENRRLLKTTSRRRLRQELRQKRVSDEVIDAVLTKDQTDERELLRGLVAKKRQQVKYQDDLKLMQYLSRQGYNYDDIKDAVREQSAEG